MRSTSSFCGSRVSILPSQESGNEFQEGGHDVPEHIIRRRFERSARNFLRHYRPLAHVWTFFDNSGATPKVVALGKNQRVRIINKGTYTTLVSRYGQV